MGPKATYNLGNTHLIKFHLIFSVDWNFLLNLALDQMHFLSVDRIISHVFSWLKVLLMSFWVILNFQSTDRIINKSFDQLKSLKKFDQLKMKLLINWKRQFWSSEIWSNDPLSITVYNWIPKQNDFGDLKKIDSVNLMISLTMITLYFIN